jgi:hypothetical protein
MRSTPGWILRTFMHTNSALGSLTLSNIGRAA